MIKNEIAEEDLQALFDQGNAIRRHGDTLRRLGLAWFSHEINTEHREQIQVSLSTIEANLNALKARFVR